MSDTSPSPAISNPPQSSAPSPKPVAKPVRRREKTQFSCTLCRAKKLKCDRGQPCRSCSGRGLAKSCVYVHSPAQSRVETDQAAPKSSSSNIQKKVNQLEDLVISLMASLNTAKQAEEARENSVAQTPPPPAGNSITTAANGGSIADGLEGDLMCKFTDAFGKISLEGSGMKYVDSGHWTAILDGISEIKGHFEAESSQAPDPAPEATDSGMDGPLLLFGCNNHVTKHEIISAIPPRSVVDRLLSTYFNQMDLAPVVVHSPTFLKEYEKFWENPSATPAMWLGLLFSMMCLAVHFQKCAQSGTVMDNPALQSAQEHEYLLQTYREKVAQCLVLGKYTKSVPYTISTLLLYFTIEYFQCEDTQVGPWILLGMILRIAMRMGYHRDPSHDPRISPFQAEMRRRAWAVLVRVDLANSHQVGLPRMVREGLSDTMEPRNLFDSDIHEDMSELPPSRPLTEATPMLYIISKNKILRGYARAIDFNGSTTIPPYSQVMRLERLIHEARKAIPPSLQPLSMRQYLTDTPDMLMARICLDTISHSSLCMLHRRYLLSARTNPQYKHSRKTCIETALHMLHYQAVLHEETQLGGQLYDCRWKISGVINNDFLFATTLLCLDLNYDLVYGPPKSECLCEGDVDQAQRVNVVKALQGSYRIWRLSSHSSKEARKAAEAVRIVLGKIERRDGSVEQFKTPFETNGRPEIGTSRYLDSPQQSYSPSSINSFMTSVDSQASTCVGSTMATPSPVNMGHLGDPSNPDNFDWETWTRDFAGQDMTELLNSNYSMGALDYDFLS